MDILIMMQLGGILLWLCFLIPLTIYGQSMRNKQQQEFQKMMRDTADDWKTSGVKRSHPRKTERYVSQAEKNIREYRERQAQFYKNCNAHIEPDEWLRRNIEWLEERIDAGKNFEIKDYMTADTDKKTVGLLIHKSFTERLASVEVRPDSLYVNIESMSEEGYDTERPVE